MGGRRRLSAGMPRMLGRHDAIEGARFRRAWAALVAEFGPPARGSLLALEMGRTAVTYSNLLAASEALAVARQTRATGKGRRPSAGKIERLSRRHGLANKTYSEALEKLREMATRQRTGHRSVEELLAQAWARPGERPDGDD